MEYDAAVQEECDYFRLRGLYDKLNAFKWISVVWSLSICHPWFLMVSVMGKHYALAFFSKLESMLYQLKTTSVIVFFCVGKIF